MTVTDDISQPLVLTIGPSDQDQTHLIQSAIDTDAEKVEVRLSHGLHKSRGLRLKSGVSLVLDAGCNLCFEPTYAAYEATEVDVSAEQSNRAMITAQGAENISISGLGKIFCDGSDKFSDGVDHVMGTRIPKALRPRVMVLDQCSHVTVSGIRVEDSPMWTLHLVDCEQVLMRDLNIDNDREMPNTDGIVIDGCRDVMIENCEIRTADDGVVLKTSCRDTGALTGDCADVSVRNCVIESRSCALKLGTESFSDFRRILFEDCAIEASNRGLGIFSRDGGVIDQVTFRNIKLDCRETPDGFWGSGEPVTITVVHRRPETRKAGIVQNVVIEGISGLCDGAINMYSEDKGLIDKVALSNLDFHQRQGALGTAQRYDIRPTPLDLIPSDDAAGRINAWRLGEDGKVIGLKDYPGGFPALFASGVTNMELGEVTVVRPTPLPEGWNEEPVVFV